jgi:hypothetical protein
MAEHAWRPLGELLVERGLIDEHQLASWLKQQKLSGMLLGELLVQHRVVSPMEVAAALAVQRGADGVERGLGGGSRQLGRILVEQGLLTESGLQRALLAQQRRGGAIGEILVERGYVSQQQVDDALAGNDSAASTPSAVQDAGAAQYEVYEPGATGPVYVSETFLDATDYAFDLIESEDPDALEIVESRGEARDVAWSYARPEPA